mmetsp:Transcript_9195/g.23044  ORF Transcript_9195/g.23044 Transcript_9195/m.23044 type:complete len:261 (-) Transcript_9195:779-1561(-)
MERRPLAPVRTVEHPNVCAAHITPLQMLLHLSLRSSSPSAHAVISNQQATQCVSNQPPTQCVNNQSNQSVSNQSNQALSNQVHNRTSFDGRTDCLSVSPSSKSAVVKASSWHSAPEQECSAMGTTFTANWDELVGDAGVSDIWLRSRCALLMSKNGQGSIWWLHPCHLRRFLLRRLLRRLLLYNSHQLLLRPVSIACVWVQWMSVATMSANLVCDPLQQACAIHWPVLRMAECTHGAGIHPLNVASLHVVLWIDPPAYLV